MILYSYVVLFLTAKLRLQWLNRSIIGMANDNSEDLASLEAKNEDNREVANASKALEVSEPHLPSSQPGTSSSIKTGDSGEHAPDSGYGSVTSTPESKDTTNSPRKPSQIPFVQQLGLCVSKKAMEAGAKRRFLEVQLEIEKMLLELLRKLKSGIGRHKPVAIRPMMLGKTEEDIDANCYMVVICPDNVKRKIQDFFDEDLVRSLCEPGEDDVPSFKVLVVGHALRLRASLSDITVQCGAMEDSYDGTKTFCGMPIRLRDGLGHSRNATFGGVVKIKRADGSHYELFGLTAGHAIEHQQVVPSEDESALFNLNSTDLLGLSLNQELIEASEHQTRTASQPINNDISLDDSDQWYSSNQHNLGALLNTDRGSLVGDGDPSRMRPSLDWALFALNTFRPNKLPLVAGGNSGGDLHLPSPTRNVTEDEICVSMLCASRDVKRGLLSTTRVRVLLDPGGSFTDAYTLLLEDSRGEYFLLESLPRQ